MLGIEPVVKGNHYRSLRDGLIYEVIKVFGSGTVAMKNEEGGYTQTHISSLNCAYVREQV